MKFLDYGKMAASFLNLKSGKAVRIVAREDARDLAKTCFPKKMINTGHSLKHTKYCRMMICLP